MNLNFGISYGFLNINDNPYKEGAKRKKTWKIPKKKLTNKNYVSKLKIVCQKFVFLLILGGIKMIDYLRNLFISWFNKILNWFSERQKKETNTKKEIPFGKNKHADDDRAKRISEGFQALDEGCKSIANLRAEIEMSQTESKTFKDNEPKVNNDLDAPVPANNNIKNNLEEYKMGNFWGPKTPEECQKEIEKHEQQIKELEKKKLKFQNKEGVTPIKPVGQEKLLSSNISPISMRSNNDNSNWMDPNDLNNTFEYQNVDKKALNAMGTKIKQDVKQEIKKEMDDRFAESTNNINQLKEDMKEVKKDIKDIKDEQIDLKKMIARSDEMIADNKRRLDKAEKMLEDMKEERKDTKRMLAKMEEDKKVHDELMAALWNKLDEWNGIKQPTREGSDNRESTNTSLSSFKYKNPFRNNKRQPKMERADMAHSYDDNE